MYALSYFENVVVKSHLSSFIDQSDLPDLGGNTSLNDSLQINVVYLSDSRKILVPVVSKR